jgi:surface polysaccharide O-acyltransferase-like enzyme
MAKAKLIYPDLLRIAAILGVILIHVTAPTIGELPRMNQPAYWWLDHLINSAARWSVPVFFMISGMFVLNSDKVLQVKSYLLNRAARLMPLFLMWSLIYYVWGIRDHVQTFQWDELIKGFLQDKLHYHLWFLYTLIALYLIAPLLRIIVKHVSAASVFRISLVCLVAYNVSIICGLNQIKLGIEIPKLTGYIGYFLLGTYLSLHTLSVIQRRLLYAAAFVSYLVIVGGHFKWMTIMPDSTGNSYFYNYCSIPVAFIAVAVFTAFKSLPTENLSSKAIQTIHGISASTFSIYLSHLLFFELFYQIHPWDVRNGNPIIYVPMIATAVLVSSYFYAIVQKWVIKGFRGGLRSKRDYNKMGKTELTIRDAYRRLSLSSSKSDKDAIAEQIRKLKTKLNIPLVKNAETMFTDNKVVRPHFLIVGTQKGGTTSLYNYLIQHPNVHSAVVKEIHFFDEQQHWGMDWYLTHFPESLPEGDITGEATPYYLFHPHVPQRIKHTLPDVKIIVLLRNPIERAFSHYQMMVRRGVETLSFSEAIRAESGRIDVEYERMEQDEDYFSAACSQFSYLKRGLYSEQLERWFSLFAREEILVIRSEDLQRKTEVSYNQVLQFLQLPDWKLTDYFMHHEGGYQEEIDINTRTWLERYFEADQKKLAQLLEGESCR